MDLKHKISSNLFKYRAFRYKVESELENVPEAVTAQLSMLRFGEKEMTDVLHYIDDT